VLGSRFEGCSVALLRVSQLEVEEFSLPWSFSSELLLLEGELK